MRISKPWGAFAMSPNPNNHGDSSMCADFIGDSRSPVLPEQAQRSGAHILPLGISWLTISGKAPVTGSVLMKSVKRVRQEMR